MCRNIDSWLKFYENIGVFRYAYKKMVIIFVTKMLPSLFHDNLEDVSDKFLTKAERKISDMQ